MKDLFERQASSKGLKLVLNIDKLNDYCQQRRVSLTVVQDKERLEQVLANLISNAIKYSRKGTIEIRAKVVQTLYRGPQYSVKIIDEGIGNANTALLGKMFQQLDTKDNVNQNGTGFGLTITNLLVKHLGGTFEIKQRKPQNDLEVGLIAAVVFPDSKLQLATVESIQHSEESQITQKSWVD